MATNKITGKRFEQHVYEELTRSAQSEDRARATALNHAIYWCAKLCPSAANSVAKQHGLFASKVSS